jgi:flagellar hook-associated protein FlgK
MTIGFVTGLRALLAARRAMDVIGHNLANQNTPGYARQIALLQTSFPVPGPGGLRFGTGVDLVAVRSLANESLLGRIRAQYSLAGRYAAESSVLEEMETILGDLEEGNLHSRLQDFFDAAGEAALNPEDDALRRQFIEAGADLAAALRQRRGGLAGIEESVLEEARAIVASANSLLAEVADLNERIRIEEASGAEAHDLRGRREAALETLSDLVGARASRLQDGTVNVSVGTMLLVTGSEVRPLSAQRSAGGGLLLQAEGSASSIEADSGRLGGLLGVVASFLPDRLADLDQLARNLILETNRVHATGVPRSGPFRNLVSAFAVSPAAGQNPLTVTLSGAGLPFSVREGSLSVAVTNLETGEVSRTTLAIDPDTMSVGGFVAALDGIPHLDAFLDATGRLRLNAAPGYGFDFSRRLDSDPVEGGTFGSGSAVLVGSSNFPVSLSSGSQLSLSVDGGPAQTVTFNAADFANISAATAQEVAAVIEAQTSGVSASVVDGRLVLRSDTTGAASSLAVADVSGTPAAILGLPSAAQGTDTPVRVTVSGTSTASQAASYRFVAVGDGRIGETPGLEVQVLDASGGIVATLSVGEGYEPGSALEIADGVSVSFSAGTIQGSAGQSFVLDVPGEPDTTDLLAAFGVNAFFTGTDATNIDVVSSIRDSTGALAGAADGGPGDGGNFLRLQALADLSVAGLAGGTFGGFTSAFAAEIGAAAAGASSSLDSSTIVLAALEARRAEVSGVNPDEEFLDLERFQLAYEAAARYLSVVSDLESLLFQI